MNHSDSTNPPFQVIRGGLEENGLQRIKGQIFADIDNASYARASTLEERIALYEQFVTSQMGQQGVRISIGVWGLGKFNRETLKDFYPVSRDFFSALKEHSWSLAIETGGIFLTKLVKILFQYQPPSVNPIFTKEGNWVEFQYANRGKIYWTNLLTWATYTFLDSRNWLDLMFDPFFYFFSMKGFVWFINRIHKAAEGHEWTHGYQFVTLERIRRELAVPLNSGDFFELVP